MRAQITSSTLGRKETIQKNWFQRLSVFLLFLVCGLLVFIVFSHYFPIFEPPVDILRRAVIGIACLAAALIARRNVRFNKYWLISFAFFAALTAISIDRYLGLSKYMYPALGMIERSLQGWAVDKFESSLLGIIVVLVLNRLAGQSVDSLYFRRGNLRLGPVVGLVAFVVMIATVIPVTETYFKGQMYYIQIGCMLAWLIVTALLDYILKIDFRNVRWMVISFVVLFFAGTGGILGVAANAGRGWSISAIVLFLIMTVLTFVQRAVTGM